MAGEHACAVDGCAKLAKAGQLMCFPHWKGLPRAHQVAVNCTWARYRFEPEAYREAKDAAVAWWAGHAEEQGSLL